MSVYPRNVSELPSIELKLGIKSSFPNVLQAIALLYLIWKVCDKKQKFCYCIQDNSSIKPEPNLLTSLREIYEKNDFIIGDDFDSIIESNPLFSSQIEHLNVACELIWKLAHFDFVDERKAFSAERSGGERFLKKISFTANIDVIDSLVEMNERQSFNVLCSWLLKKSILEENKVVENSLIRVLTYFSEDAFYQIRNNDKNILFRNLEVYKEIINGNDVNLKGEKDNNGPLRILCSSLKEGTHFYVSSQKDGDSYSAKLRDENLREEFENYSSRVELYLLDSSKNIGGQERNESVIERKCENPNVLAFNRILFGAPGTGKSWLLNKDASEKFDGRIGQKELDDDEKIKTLVQSVGSDLSLRLSIGVKFESKLKSLTPKEIQTRYSCDGRIAYRICQGAKIKDISSKLQDLSGDDLNAVNIVGEIDKISSDRQASYAAIGYKYAPFFYECTYGDVAKILGFAGDTTSTVQWISAGAKIRENQDDGSLESREKMSYIERVTFHPHYSYAQFVGTYKPVQDEEDSKSVVYSYVPGPFMRTYVRAKRAEQNGTEEKFLLIIEEINRANVAAVFGDVFQLLDRHGSGEHKGESEYPVAASEDIKRYLRENGIQDCNELKIPSNMYIWATINSADQGVFPMDTAFKRRWEFEYIGIDKNETWDYTIPLPNGESINWNVLRKAINGTLKKIASVNEDKLLGPYFLSKAVLEDANKWNSEQDSEEKQKAVEKFLNTFKSKVLMYLYEDVCKMRPGDVFKIKLEDGQTRLHYSDICDAFDKTGIGIFDFEKADIEDKYKQKI